ncbi:MAG: single-stranded-DNA-specific exonuclease RecJ, partial [Bacteroidetes bacterium]
MRKQWNLLPADETEVKNLQQALRIRTVFCRLLVQRGIKTYEAAKGFFRPSLSDLHDPFLMKDMAKAVERIELAILRKEKVLLYGDYDVDGTTSVALMLSFFAQYLPNLDYYLPDRYKEGYGVSDAGIAYAQKRGISLIIAMDCGINAVRQVALANRLGIDFIICDHHLPKVECPPAVAILNPKQTDCAYPFKELSGCGVAFKLVQAFIRKNKRAEQQLWELLDFVVLSIACDIVPMVGENRVLAFYGLRRLNQTRRIGLQSLIAASRRPLPLNISDVVFGLGPLINAAGRLADAHTAVKLMLSQNDYIAREYAEVLQNRNARRKDLDVLIGEEAKSLFKQTPDQENRNTVVLFQPHWHRGMLGIAASRVAEYFHRPTIILTESEGKAVGSGRTIP